MGTCAVAEIVIEDPTRVEERIEVAARFISSSGTWRLWYRVEEERAADLTQSADAFVRAFIHLAMQAGEDVVIHGEVSPSLLANLELFQQAWCAWIPQRYQQVELRARSEKESTSLFRPAAISGFTGGVDSCFTAYRHTRAITTRYPLPLKAVVMAHGFDIPVEDKEGFLRASEKAERQVRALGLQMFRVETNFRELPVNWVHAFGSAVASVLALFSGRFDTGLIASGVPYAAYRTIVEGSNPLTDPLLSSDSFRVICDGAGFGRIEKIEILSQWQEGLNDLRVCSRNLIRYENCCVCEKCIRNMLSFRVLGLDPPRCFDRDVTEKQIRNLGPLKELILEVGYRPILQRAKEQGIEKEPWVRALRTAFRRNRWSSRIARTRILWRLPRLKRRVMSLFSRGDRSR